MKNSQETKISKLSKKSLHYPKAIFILIFSSLYYHLLTKLYLEQHLALPGFIWVTTIELTARNKFWSKNLKLSNKLILNLISKCSEGNVEMCIIINFPIKALLNSSAFFFRPKIFGLNDRQEEFPYNI